MKKIDKLKEMNGQIHLLRDNLKSLEMLDEQEINLIITDCLVDDGEEVDNEPRN